MAKGIVGAFAVKPDAAVLGHGLVFPAVRDQVQGISETVPRYGRRPQPNQGQTLFPVKSLKVNRDPQMLGHHSRVVTLVAVESVNHRGEGAHLGIG